MRTRVSKVPLELDYFFEHYRKKFFEGGPKLLTKYFKLKTSWIS